MFIMQINLLNSCKGYEILMVKIGDPSMSEAFEPPPADDSGRFSSKSKLGVIEEYFHGDWRLGQDISKVVITQRFYQVSSNATQA